MLSIGSVEITGFFRSTRLTMLARAAIVASAFLIVCFVQGRVPAQAALQETVSFSTDHLTVRNVVGQVRVEGHSGSDFQVEARIEGADAREGMVQLERSEGELEVRFPDVSDIVYPALGNDSTTLRLDGDGWLSRLLGGRKLRVRGSGSGTELWVDLTIRVPHGAHLEVEHAVGKVAAAGVDGELELSTRTGDIEISDARGELSAATGSGNIEARRVTATRIEIASGSGDVELADLDGDRLTVATGSGDVDIDSVRGEHSEVATGSGRIRFERSDVENLDLATGSGKVTLGLDRVGTGEYSVGTGSGDIAMTLPPGASVDVHAETDNGRISVDLAGVSYQKDEPDEVRFTVGNADARIRLGSGSGNIRLR